MLASEMILSTKLMEAVIPYADIVDIEYESIREGVIMCLCYKHSTMEEIHFETRAESITHIRELLTEAKKHHAVQMAHALNSEDSEYWRYKRMQCLALLRDYFGG